MKRRQVNVHAYLFCCKLLISTIPYHHIRHFLPKARDDPLKATLFACMKGNHRENNTLDFAQNPRAGSEHHFLHCHVSCVPILVAL